MVSGIVWTIIVLALISYGFYDKYSETKQIEAISHIENLSYEELGDLIEKIKK